MYLYLCVCVVDFASLVDSLSHHEQKAGSVLLFVIAILRDLINFIFKRTFL